MAVAAQLKTILVLCCVAVSFGQSRTLPSPLCVTQGLCTCYNTKDPPACYHPTAYHCVNTDQLLAGAEPSGECAIADDRAKGPLPAVSETASEDDFDIPADSSEASLLFQDDFVDLDTSRWGFDIGDGSDYGIPGWGNAEFQCYTSDSANVAIIPNPENPSDGVLRISSKYFDTPQQCLNRHSAASQKSWTSAKLVTKNLHSFAPQLGPSGCQSIVVESRISVPWKQGHWAALWMLPQDPGAGWPKSGEIDVMEHINLAQEVLGTVHLANAEGYHMQAPPSNKIPLSASDLQGFNTYKVVWGCEKISWHVNDQHAISLEASSLPSWPFGKPFYVLLNLAVGGSLPGFEVDTSGGELLVDYVQVYTAST